MRKNWVCEDTCQANEQANERTVEQFFFRKMSRVMLASNSAMARNYRADFNSFLSVLKIFIIILYINI